MSSTYGEHLKLSIFGQSHGAAIGMILDGIPAGLSVDFDTLQRFLNRRAPGQNGWSTPRKEEDEPDFLGGILNGFTCGAPICAVVSNRNTRSSDYNSLKSCPRPGHADYSAQMKYGGFQDAAGGGHFSGRLTAPLCIAGGLCKQWLEQAGIQIGAHIFSIGAEEDAHFDSVNPNLEDICNGFPVLDERKGIRMKALIEEVKSQHDSIGGIIECAITGLPAGIGEPMFGGVENRIAQIIYGIPAVKGIEFGAGFSVGQMRGSQCNDPYYSEDNCVKTLTNNAGGILGGITNAMPVIFRCAVKPTPSIGCTQQSVNLASRESSEIQIQGRHDPCIVPRAVPVVEAAAAIAIFDMILGNSQGYRRK